MSAFEGAIDPVLLEGIGGGLSVIEKVSEAAPRYPGKGALAASLRTIFSYGLRALRPAR